ncbi:MAG: class I SAM-dependent methyltransferase [Candidatus Omnitrophota bacterium]|jgi:D-alanine-D-alanine ligase
MIRVKGDWWKDFFNHIYLATDSRSVCNAELTSRETDLLERILDLDKTDRILDLFGGQGRHSIELAKRGYRDLSVLDYSNYLINLGKQTAKKEKLKINFYQGDARSTRLASNDYSAILVMANSFGYFPEERENLRVLREINRILRVGGRLFLDLTNPVYVKNRLEPVSWHRTGSDFIIFRKREIKDNRVNTQEIVISKKQGLLRNGYYCERLYSKTKISQLLKKAGFKNIKIKKNLSLHKKRQDYGLLTSRMAVIASKA